jgi:hypothetical protein
MHRLYFQSTFSLLNVSDDRTYLAPSRTYLT